MASSQQDLYPFISSSDDGFDSSCMTDNSAPEPTSHPENVDSHLIEQLQSRISTKAASEAEKVNLHPDVIYKHLPIDVLVFGRSGVGKSTLIKAIANDPTIETSSQLDHVTKKAQYCQKKIGKLTFRFWDTKGIDKWSVAGDVQQFLKEIEENKIKPLFVIYCSSGFGRVDSAVVTSILKELRGTKMPIAYVITNIYSHDDEQLQGQTNGGLQIMTDIYLKDAIPKNKYYYEFDVLTDNDGTIVRDGKGCLIAVNSKPYINTSTNTNKPILNLFELMSFIGDNLDDEDFAKYVALTLKNRSFWEQNWDKLLTKFYQCRDRFKEFGIIVRDFVWNQLKNRFPSDTES